MFFWELQEKTQFWKICHPIVQGGAIHYIKRKALFGTSQKIKLRALTQLINGKMALRHDALMQKGKLAGFCLTREWPAVIE